LHHSPTTRPTAQRVPPWHGTAAARSRWCALGACTAIALATAAAPAAAATLSDNSANASAGTLAASSTQWLADSFVNADTAGDGMTLQAVLNATTQGGTPQVSLYSSDASGLIPDTFLASLSAQSSTATTATFSLSGYTLTAGSTYWIVLGNNGSTSTWSWTANSAGAGSGFTGAWASSDDAGDSFFVGSALVPLQMAVSTAAAVPEPGTAATLGLGLLALLAAAPGLRRATTTHRTGDRP
jgi:hypothetical protein